MSSVQNFADYSFVLMDDFDDFDLLIFQLDNKEINVYYKLCKLRIHTTCNVF